VLHNVGNVLNSVNVSATLVADHVRHTQAVNIAKVAALFQQHQADLDGFLTYDPRGRMIPGYLGTLGEALIAEHTAMLKELDHLRANVDHIKDIVAMQQSYASHSGVIETVSVPDLIEDALRTNTRSLARHEVGLHRDYQARPVVTTDKHKVIQILINLVRNAKQACNESDRPDKEITVRTTSDDRGVKIAIVDNGVGIPRENLTRIFAHGFTTRKTGHGFGLHSAALAAQELGGSLTAQSDGPGRGAPFTLELPANPTPPAHENSPR
jgi:signal transduction histidine kinase